MKAISIQQPWAWAILHAGKDIENRAWSTSYRGDLAVHATQIQPASRLPSGVSVPPEQDLVLGSVIGLVQIADVVTESSSRWFSGPFGFVLRNPRPLARPVRCPGDQKIWDLPAWVEMAVRRSATRPEQLVIQARSGELKELPQLRSSEVPDRLTDVAPEKAGKRWTAAEEAELVREFEAGGRIRQLAVKHGRTDLSIRGRLYRLGKLPAWSASRQQAEEANGLW